MLYFFLSLGFGCLRPRKGTWLPVPRLLVPQTCGNASDIALASARSDLYPQPPNGKQVSSQRTKASHNLEKRMNMRQTHSPPTGSYQENQSSFPTSATRAPCGTGPINFVNILLANTPPVAALG